MKCKRCNAAIYVAPRLRHFHAELLKTLESATIAYEMGYAKEIARALVAADQGLCAGCVQFIRRRRR